jgi:hypothetical protein
LAIRHVVRCFFNEFRQYEIQLNSNCLYRCLDCGWWRHDDDGGFQIDSRILRDVPRHRIVNLLGGDPLVHPDFDRVLMALQKKGCQIRLWSTGVGSIDRWIAILAILDRLYLYVPSGDPCQYQSIVGTYTWDQLGEQLDVFNSEAVVSDRTIWLNYEVRSDTIQFLPELYEFSMDKKCSLLIHCDGSKLLDRESILYLKRFYKIPNVSVFFTKKKKKETVYKQRCSGVSSTVIRDQWQMVKNFNLRYTLGQ